MRETYGTVEIQDLLLTSKSPTPGVVLVGWNIQAKMAGAAALWDVHVRLGGATGTQLTVVLELVPPALVTREHVVFRRGKEC
jgi:hypothetical protein